MATFLQLGVLIKANYTKHLCIDHSSTHMLPNTGVVPYKELTSPRHEGRYGVDATKVSLLNDDVTNIFDILLSVAMHCGKTFISPLRFDIRNREAEESLR